MVKNVLDYMADSVKRVPDKVAFSDGEEALTFLDVYKQSCSVGTFLCQNGVYKEPVVIFMNKHPKMVAAFLGTIAGGNYYVPIDAEMPEIRIRLILQNVKAKVMICDEETAQIAKKFDFNGMIVIYDQICYTDIDETALADIRSKSIDTDPIYIVFTSGSTGIPKGVAACHRSVIDYIENISEVLGFNENTIFGNQSPLYVDACLREIYPTLKYGATDYLIPREYFSFPVKLVEYLNEHKINTVCWVVSALTMISAFGTFKTIIPHYLHTIAFVSEVFPIKQFNRWKEAVPEGKFVNLYGPTEGTGVCCYFEVDREFELDEIIPIGKPIPNREILLLNEKNEAVKQGEAGEICIRGTNLTLGYYNDWDRTNDVFVQNPLNPYYPELIYKTGDLGKYNERGELEFISRKDFQIKHMGHRIELGEIEVNVNMLDAIDMACCIYDNIKNKIVLYYVGDMDEREMANVLKEKLPRYMIPNSIIKMDELPLTANGKIDRVTLKNKYQNK